MEPEQRLIFIDADVLINLFDSTKPKNSLADLTLEHLLTDGYSLFTSVIAEIEILQGSKPIVDRKRLSRQLKRFQSVAVNDEISFLARDLIMQYSSSHGLYLGDSLIAATALFFKAPLFTFNKKDFRFIAGLNLDEA